jgi:hypothetical protein
MMVQYFAPAPANGAPAMHAVHDFNDLWRTPVGTLRAMYLHVDVLTGLFPQQRR